VNLIQTLQQAGFKGPALQSAWAIAMRESGGNPQAFNGNTKTGDRSWGLFQINTLGSLAGRVKQLGLKSEHDLLDPLTNAKAAFVMSKGGTDFGAWAVGPNAYKGAPSDAVSKYQHWLGLFPGASNQAQQTAVGQAAQAAWASGPAAIVAGPSPQQELQQRQMEVASIVDAGKAIVNGGTSNPGALFTSIISARQNLAKAAMAANQSNVGALKYDGSTQDPGFAAAPGERVTQAIQIAKAQIGKPYVWGAENPKVGFDCSGLIDYAFKKAGIPIPGRMTTKTALRMGQSVRGMPMQPGDWLITNGGEHMVMYVGHGQVIAAPHKGETVQYQPVSRFAGNTLDIRRIKA
jgi:cell wall-associated NlpC family hydrolase